MGKEQKKIAFIINMKVEKNKQVSLPYGGQSGNHWISVIVDAKLGKLHYYDPYHYQIPQQLHDIFCWWVEQDGFKGKLKVSLMQGTQQTDGYSCGIFATNTILHHFIPAIIAPYPNLGLKTLRISDFST
jgi:hypothetical protein